MTARQFGPRLDTNGVTFRLWAPAASKVDVMLENAVAMTRRGDGWFELALPDAGAGIAYSFRIDGERTVPDPASSFQPGDVNGPSEVIDHAAYRWTQTQWRGRPWHEAVILELHVGTFTPDGTFLSAIDRLDDVAAAGFTAIELMPVADYAGRWNWGYDGVLWYAPASSYGRPDDLKALVDAAHQRGLMIFLDVVYNHFGPEGNYLGSYAPDFFTRDVDTPWGAAIDYCVPQVRAFAIGNALHWLEHYRFDGLRLDAIHAIAKRGDPSVLDELSAVVGNYAVQNGRHIHLVVENDDNTATLLDPLTETPRGRYRAQWNDDAHHAWHVLLTGETTGYYRDYAEAGQHLARVLASGFAYQGEASPHRGGAPRGEPSDALHPGAFISFLQNHDQIGNRPRGERLDALAPAEAIEAALAVMLLAPSPPLMFMGEEWGSCRPFPFFCDFSGDLAAAVRAGRRREFSEAYAHQDRDGAVPDPLAEATFRSAVLDWDACSQPQHARRLDLVQRLLACRAQHIWPLLASPASALGSWAGTGAWADGLLAARWGSNGRLLHLLANLSDEPKPAIVRPGNRIWGDSADGVLAPWSVLWTLGDA